MASRKAAIICSRNSGPMVGIELYPVRYKSRWMAPEAISNAAPAIPYQDRRGSDAPHMLPTTLITWSPAFGFNGVCNKTVSPSAVIGQPGGTEYGQEADHQGDGGRQAAAGRGAAGVGAGCRVRPAVPAAARRARGV